MHQSTLVQYLFSGASSSSGHSITKKLSGNAHFSNKQSIQRSLLQAAEKIQNHMDSNKAIARGHITAHLVLCSLHSTQKQVRSNVPVNCGVIMQEKPKAEYSTSVGRSRIHN